MPDYLLDTNILSYWYNQKCAEHAKVLARIYAVRNPDPTTGYVSRLYISAITLGEIQSVLAHRIFPTRQNKPNIQLWMPQNSSSS